MQVTVLAFAGAADSLGWRELSAECSPQQTPIEVIRSLAPGFEPGTWRAAVNHDYRPWDEPVGPDAHEIAIIPPVSGG